MADRKFYQDHEYCKLSASGPLSSATFPQTLWCYCEGQCVCAADYRFLHGVEYISVNKNCHQLVRPSETLRISTSLEHLAEKPFKSTSVRQLCEK